MGSNSWAGRIAIPVVTTMNLAKPDKRWLLGALRRVPGLKDWHLENAPGVVQAAAGLPAAFACIAQADVQVLYAQIGSSCVPTSICTVKGVEDFFDVKVWNEYDPQEMYHYLGGTGPNGVPTDRTLQYTRDVGCLQVATGRRWQIGGYAFAPQQPGLWRRTIAAAMVASGPVVIATLLPQTFGWDSFGPLTSGYHQMAATEYDGLGDNDHVIFANTWGRGGGRNGFYRMTWAQLEGNNFQESDGFRHCYGYQLIDVDDADLPPPVPIPEPSPAATPIITRVKYKAGRKLVVNGMDFHPAGRLILDGDDTGAARHADGRFIYRVKGLIGEHDVRVLNPQKQSDLFAFTVG